MSGFSLDTSGTVFVAFERDLDGSGDKNYAWSDLSPFTQGYVEALFAAHRGALTIIDLASCVHRDARFSDLSPEALAAIMADCARFREYGRREGFKFLDNTSKHGAAFWSARNTRPWPTHAYTYERDGFPPQTITLSNDGKVHLRSASS